MRKAIIVVVGAGCAYLLLELLALVALNVVHEGKPNAFGFSIDDHFEGLDDAYLKSYLDGEYHEVLGWDQIPGSQETKRNCLREEWTETYDDDGSRVVPGDYDTTLIASYGDSYFKGGEINDDQTWQYHLAKQLDAGVKNYAVGAFEPYQALLKLKLHVGEGNVYPITVLGINEQNIRRTLNLFRAFIYRKVSAKLSFKPGITCEDGRCETIENLLRPDTGSIDEAKALAREARKLDYWARRKPLIEYSWLANLIKLARLSASVGVSKSGEPFWQSEDAMAAMHMVVDEFRDVSMTADSIPVVLFIPTRPKPGDVPSYELFKEQVRARHPELHVLDLMESEFDTARYKLKPTGECHPSEYGHEAIAQTVYQGLRDVLDPLKGRLRSQASMQR